MKTGLELQIRNHKGAMSEEAEILQEVCRRLDAAKISYMVTGSVAANFYAVPRMTRDIDIVIEVKKEDARRIVEIFKNDFYIDFESVKDAIDRQGMFNLIHNQYVIKIDFIIRKSSKYRGLEFDRRQKIPFEGMEISVVSVEDLILSKLFWAKDSLSEMQLGDVENLLATVKNVDFQYLDNWVRELGLQNIYKKLKQ